MSQQKWRCLKGAVLNIKFGPFYVFSRVFFTPPRYDYPLDATLVLWQYESRIRGGLLYKDENPSKFFFHDPPRGKKLGPEAMPKFLIVMYMYDQYICYCYCIAGHSLGALVYLKTKLKSDIISVVFFSCFKKFEGLGDVLDFVTPMTICHIEVPSFRRFYNLAQILI